MKTDLDGRGGHHPPRGRANAEHYVWGDGCDGWRLLAHPDLAVIEERVPAGAAEVRHAHERARQFFYVLSGTATIEVDDMRITLEPGQGFHVEPGTPHRFVNDSTQDVVFLVISSPATTGDRIDAADEGHGSPQR